MGEVLGAGKSVVGPRGKSQRAGVENASTTAMGEVLGAGKSVVGPRGKSQRAGVENAST